VTSDISLAGALFVPGSLSAESPSSRHSLPQGSSVEGLAVVRIVKARVGMGIEFIDIESAGQDSSPAGSNSFANAKSHQILFSVLSMCFFQ